MTALSLRDVSFSYDGKKKILKNVSLEIEKGDVVAITGSSGCGKSTLAMIACGVIPKAVHGYFSGSVVVLGEDVSDKEIYETADKISMVFQDPESQLFSPAVIDEVAFASENLCYTGDEIAVRVDKALNTVNMQAFKDHSPAMLSGGQQQLVALASILSLDPEIIILDEVAAQIDEEGVLLLNKAVAALKKQGKTVVIIEHGNAFETLYDTVYILEDGHLSRGVSS